MTLWELAAYFAVFLGGSAGGWALCALFTWARVAELNGECTRLNLELEQLRSSRVTLHGDGRILLDVTVGELRLYQDRFGPK